MSRYTDYKGNNYFTIKDEDKFRELFRRRGLQIIN